MTKPQDDVVKRLEAVMRGVVPRPPADEAISLDFRLCQDILAALRTNQRNDSLEDPNAVHVNMLAGYIAKPSVSQIIHIYGERALRDALAKEQNDE